MSNLITRNGKPNVIRGGIARQFAPGLFYMNGRTHAKGGIDIGKNPRTGVEVEDGEVVQLDRNGMRVFSAMPFLTGKSPASLVANGADPDIVFAAQENFKDRFGINDDGTMAQTGGQYKPGTIYGRPVEKGLEIVSPEFDILTLGKLGANTISNTIVDGITTTAKQRGLITARRYDRTTNKLKKDFNYWKDLLKKDFKEGNYKDIPLDLGAVINRGRRIINYNITTPGRFINNMLPKKYRPAYEATKETIKQNVVNLPAMIKLDDKNEKKMGGIHIDKNKRGTFTAVATKHGMGVQEFASRVLANKEDYSPAMVKKANFARNASRWKKPAGGIVSVNGNVKNGLVYTDRPKAKTGKYVPLIQNVKNIVFENGEAYVKDDKGRIRKATNTELDTWNKFYGNDSNFEEVPVNIDRSNTVAIEQRNNISPQILSYLHARPSSYGVYSTNKPAFTMLGMRPGWSHTYREPVNPLADFVVPRIDLTELQQSRTPVRNNTNNRIVPNSANSTITPNTVNVYGIGLDGKPVLQGTREVPQWIGSGRDDTPLNVFDNFTNVNGRGVQDNLVTIGNRQLSTSPIIPVTLPGVERVQAAVQQMQPTPDTTGGGFNLTDPAIIGAGANILGSIGSYLINRNILNESEPKPTEVRLSAQKFKTRYNINPQLDELREQAAANNRLINNNTASSRTALGRMNLLNTALGRSRAELYGTKENRETELINQDILNSQNVGNQQAIYNAQLRADYQNRLDELNRLKLANNNALFSGLTGGINSIADSLLRQRYYNNTIGAIAARNPNVDARIFRDANVDWHFMYPYSTRNRS